MRLLVLFGLLTLAYAKHEQYIGWKSYIVGPVNHDQLKSLQALSSKYDLDFLSHVTDSRAGVVLVQPGHQEGFIKELNIIGVAYNVYADDVKAKLDEDDQLIAARRVENLAKNAKEFPFDNYQQLDVIYDYLDEVASNHPDVVTLASAGNSFEGRPIKYLKVSTTNFEDTRKPIIFIDGGIHSREWISPPTVVRVIRELVVENSEPDLLENFDWILLPVVNPDGYVFTFDDTRFWRKTRSTDTNTLSPLCPGVDGNRNFDFAWNTVGTSNNPCSDIYAGNRAFSEAETDALRVLLHEHLARIALYLTIHSYGSMILYPWGHDGTLSNNALALHTVGIAMADAIHANALPSFPRYVVGNSLLVLGSGIAGSAEDYAHSIGIPLSYTYELPGLSGGLQGFHLDPIHIRQVTYETWKGIAAGARRAGALFN